MSYVNSEIIPGIGGWIRPILGVDPYNKKNVETSEKNANEAVKVMEDHLTLNTYLVGERITLADIMCAGFVSRAFEHVFDKKWRAAHPSVTRWYETIVHQPMYKAVVSEPKFADEALKNQPPAKDHAPKKEAKKEAPKAKPKDDDDDEPPRWRRSVDRPSQ